MFSSSIQQRPPRLGIHGRTVPGRSATIDGDVPEARSRSQLIWATTTPTRNRDNLQQIGERTERVKARNQIAAEIMKDGDIPTNDLYGLVEQHPDWHSGDGVHFNGKGKEAQGRLWLKVY